MEELKEDLAHEPKPDVIPKPAPDLRQRRAKVSSKRERYLEAFAENLMSREELRAALIRLDDQVFKIEAQEASKRTNPLMDPTLRRAVLKEIRLIRHAWGSASLTTHPYHRRGDDMRIAGVARVLDPRVGIDGIA